MEGRGQDNLQIHFLGKIWRHCQSEPIGSLRNERVKTARRRWVKPIPNPSSDEIANIIIIIIDATSYAKSSYLEHSRAILIEQLADGSVISCNRLRATDSDRGKGAFE